jgi:hypothetical protein
MAAGPRLARGRVLAGSGYCRRYSHTAGHAQTPPCPKADIPLESMR